MDDKKNKKKFIIPEAEIVELSNGDIITMSTTDEEAGWDGEELL